MLHGHGGEIYAIARKTGMHVDTLLDFSSNVSPLPLPAGLEQLLSDCIQQIGHLPEVDSHGVRLALARRFGLEPGQFFIAGGTTEWIYALPLVFRPGRIVIPVPTYADYIDAAACAGTRPLLVDTWHEGDPDDAERILSAVLRAVSVSCDEGSMVFLCNPNNPTGTFIPPDHIDRAARRASDTLWVIDESYAPFIGPDQESSLLCRPLPPNCVVLRSFSKIFGIPGLRLGYLVSPGGLSQRLASWARPWQVNRLAQIAGEWLVDQTGYQQEVREFCIFEKQWFLQTLAGGELLKYVHGDTHFMLFRLRAGVSSSWLCNRLADRGILIRNCSNFIGLKNGQYVRISPRGHEENQRLAREIMAVEREM